MLLYKPGANRYIHHNLILQSKPEFQVGRVKEADKTKFSLQRRIQS